MSMDSTIDDDSRTHGESGSDYFHLGNRPEIDVVACREAHSDHPRLYRLEAIAHRHGPSNVESTRSTARPALVPRHTSRHRSPSSDASIDHLAREVLHESSEREIDALHRLDRAKIDIDPHSFTLRSRFPSRGHVAIDHEGHQLRVHVRSNHRRTQRRACAVCGSSLGSRRRGHAIQRLLPDRADMRHRRMRAQVLVPLAVWNPRCDRPRRSSRRTSQAASGCPDRAATDHVAARRNGEGNIRCNH